MQQLSDEWFNARLGKATSSRFGDVMNRLRNGNEGAGRKNYRVELVLERLTGEQQNSYSNAAMEWGVETEPLARVEYQLRTGNIVEECGFIKHPKLEAGASPDGLVDKDGIVEIKCPNSATHIQTLKDKKLPSQYKPQVQGQLWITGRLWADFVSFDPRLPEKSQMIIIRVERDDEYIKELEGEVVQFLEEVDQEVKYLKEYK